MKEPKNGIARDNDDFEEVIAHTTTVWLPQTYFCQNLNIHPRIYQED